MVVDADTLFLLHGALGPFTPAERARAASERLRALADRREPVDSLAVIDRETYSEIALGDRVLVSVLDADAAAEGRPRAALARTYADSVRRVLTRARAAYGARALALAALYAALATLGLAAVLWLMRWGFPAVYRRLEALRRVRLPAIRIQQFELLSAGRLSALLVLITRAVRVALTLLVLYLYVPLVLSFFPWTAPLSRRIVGYAVTPFAAAWDGFVEYLPSLFSLVAIVIITRYALKLVHAFFRAIGEGAVTFEGFHRDWAEPTYKIARVLVMAFAAILIFPYLPGAHSDAFKSVSIFFGLLLSLGSSAAVGNVVAGVVLTYTRAFQLGDRVKIGDTVGDVTEKTLLVTRVRTIKNIEVTIPNGAVLASQVVNYSTLAAARGLVLHTTVTIGYDAPWRQVHELLVGAARRTEGVLAEPAPFVLQTSLDDFYVSYELNAYTDAPGVMAQTCSRLHANIQEAFNAGGVEIMSPHYRALRDGNAVTIPEASRAAGYEAPAFRVAVEPPGVSPSPSPPAASSARPDGARTGSA